ncbi:MAG: DegT/DnrJ/EryC1/StrS family aminotransferase [Clostridia bacterium]|nr:DegT/DnrJ/EryC1/StrS family aminotransferase [Clostridia bacterium]
MDTHNVTNTRSIPFSPPDMTELEAKYASDAILSGWITTGPRTKQLEKLIAEYTGAACCACLNSATAALELALRVLGIGPGDEVIVPVYTYTASASVVEHVGAKLMLIDSTEDGVEMDYDALERAINERTKAVIPVDLGGVPCDYERIFKAVESKRDVFRPANPLQSALNRAAVIADGAHALGAKLLFGGRLMPVGSVADFTAFSFHAVKNFTTAEGGALVWKPLPGTDDSAIYKQIQLFSLHGQNKDALAKNQLGAWEYDIIGTWYKCNMTDIMAAIGLAQFERYPSMLARRREIVEKYDAAFKPLGIRVLDHYNAQHESSGHLYITRVPGITDAQRREIITELARRGIAANVHYKPLAMMTAYKNLGFDIKDYPHAYSLYENEITLPLYTRLSDEDVEYIIRSYADICAPYLKK